MKVCSFRVQGCRVAPLQGCRVVGLWVLGLVLGASG